jgi:hypothetical protein
MTLETASLLVDDLANFGFPEFSSRFLAGLKSEPPDLLKQARKSFDFSKVAGAIEHDASLARKLKHKEAKEAKEAKSASQGAASPSLATSSSSSAA